jgi:hypothetical protein
MAEIMPGDLIYNGQFLIKCEKVDRECVQGPCLLRKSKDYNCVFIYLDEYYKLVSQEEFKKIIQIWEKDGERGLMLYDGKSPEFIDWFMKNWR